MSDRTGTVSDILHLEPGMTCSLLTVGLSGCRRLEYAVLMVNLALEMLPHKQHLVGLDMYVTPPQSHR